MIKEEHEIRGYPIIAFCKLGQVSRAAYYKWLHRKKPANEQENRRIADEIEKIHTVHPDMGYRRIRDDLERYHGIKVNDKRVLRICRKKGIRSTIKYANKGCSRQAANTQFIAENLLAREFYADSPNQKWLTDVTEFKYYIGLEKHKVYLSAILDLYDRRIVSYAIRDNNKLEAAGISQSMSRVAKCIDNGPMEGFWGIIKRERYYGKKFTSHGALVAMIEDYIEYYNNKRLQRKLGVLTPMEKHMQTA